VKPGNLPEKLKGAWDYLEILNGMCEELGISMAQLAFGYVRDMSGIDSLVIGAETAEQVQENVKLLKGPKIPEEYIERTRQYFSDVPELYLEPWRWDRDEY
jgi:aryl-alcohol dehydrogenase-like predicted oxidoreductase